MHRSAFGVVVASLLATLPAWADLSAYPDRLSLRPYFLPTGVAELAVEGEEASHNAAQFGIEGEANLGPMVSGDVGLLTQSLDGALLTPSLELKIAFSPNIGMIIRGAMTTDFRGFLFQPALGLGARIHIVPEVAVDLPGALLEYSAIVGEPCLDPVTAPSAVGPPSGYKGTVTSRCINPNGLDVTGTFVDNSSLPAVFGVVLPVGVIWSPIELFSAGAGAQLTYGATGQPPATVSAGLTTPVAPLVPNNLEVHLEGWFTHRAVDLGLRLGLVTYFTSAYGITYEASLEARIR